MRIRDIVFVYAIGGLFGATIALWFGFAIPLGYAVGLLSTLMVRMIMAMKP